jgi:hypothetical protein
VVADQLQLVFRAAALALPEDPVGPGDSWTNTVVLPFGQVAGGAPLIAKTKVTVTELVEQAGDTLARLAVVTEVPDKPLRFSFGGQSISVALSGAITGEQRFGPQGMTMRVDQQGVMRLVPP